MFAAALVGAWLVPSWRAQPWRARSRSRGICPTWGCAHDAAAGDAGTSSASRGSAGRRLAPALERALPADSRASRAARRAHRPTSTRQPTLASLALGPRRALEETARAARRGGRRRAWRGSSRRWARRSRRSATGCSGSRSAPFAACARRAGGARVTARRRWARPNWSVSTRACTWRCGSRRRAGATPAGPARARAALRDRLERTSCADSRCSAARLLGVALAWALAPGGEPRPSRYSARSPAGSALGLLTAQRARPSPDAVGARASASLVLVAGSGCGRMAGPEASVRRSSCLIRNQLGLHARACALFVKTAVALQVARCCVSARRPRGERQEHHGRDDAGGRGGRHDRRQGGGRRRGARALVAAALRLVDGKFGGEP